MVKKDTGKSLEIIDEEVDETVKTNTKETQKEVLTLFLFLFPLLLMAYTNDFIVKAGLFIYEAVLLRNYIMDQYKKISI